MLYNGTRREMPKFEDNLSEPLILLDEVRTAVYAMKKNKHHEKIEL